MSIGKEEILKISQLAHLQFSPEELERFSGECTRILHFLEMINTLDLTDVEPTSHASVSGKAQRLREDVARAVFSPDPASDAVVQQAPDGADGFFQVPRVIV